MRFLHLSMMMLILSFAASAATLTTDPLTGLPLDPASDSRHLGNEPVKLPEATVCKSKMQGDFYTGVDSKVDATIAWYAAHLAGFHQLHGYKGRSQDFFFNDGRTVFVIVTGRPAKDGENAETYSVAYETYNPGMSEKTLAGMAQGKMICQ